jgi:DNA-binding response OmpR family regulator
MSARVLVIDDDETICRALATALERAGYQVTTAPDAMPAMELTDNFDAIISDYRMRTATGADVVEHFKRRFADKVFCIVLSGDDDEATTTRCRDAGADAVLQKPIMPSELRRRLAEAFGAMRAAA